jgi:protein-S-isoprenylcysteine O-methyltransferase Ste14
MQESCESKWEWKMKRAMVFAYGIFSYAVFLGVFLYAIGFIGNLMVPNSLDSPPHSSIGFALAVNGMLLALFAIQHSLMARPFFKRWLTQYIPEPAERSTYVLASNAAMIMLFVFWQPLGLEIWSLDNPVVVGLAYTIFFTGWGIVFIATCLINHFDLFGLRQVWLYFRGRPYVQLKFSMPGPYKLVRHPLYVGWILVFWATPVMTAGHLFFAIGTTIYILVAIQLEERDLTDAHGVSYVAYRNEVPMLIPRLGPSRPSLESGVHRV